MLSRLKARHDSDDNGDESTILREEVEKAVKRLKDRKTPGIDDIPSELIKAGGPTLITDNSCCCCYTGCVILFGKRSSGQRTGQNRSWLLSRRRET